MTESIKTIILMGVTGSGKTTLGRLLAERLGWQFFDGDDYHPPENIRKMAAGIPLTDENRFEWLQVLAGLIGDVLDEGKSAVLACSALKQRYRDILNVDPRLVRFVYLKGSPKLIRFRVQQRSGHYMKAGMVESQFAALEEPDHALTLDIQRTPEECAGLIMDAFQLTTGEG